jgi:hypothetical protein
MFVYVLNNAGVPLMPTRRLGKVRRMLKSGEAVIVDYEPFTIKLTYQTTNYVQDITLGVDTGSIHVGLSATSQKYELYASEIDLRSKQIKKRLDKKREERRTRRSRLRYRKSRFNNRIRTKKKGWLAPSMQHRIDSHLRIIDKVSKILPIKIYRVEIGLFDTQKISNPNISSEEYQQGQTLEYANVKAFVRFRDKNTCQQCKGKSGNKRIEVHHIKPRGQGGSNRPDNLVCLCKTCHDNHHHNGLKLKKFSLNKKNAVTLRDTAAMNIIKDRVLEGLREMYPDKVVKCTYGYITRFNRNKYNISKSHANDAYVIAKNFNAEPLDYYFKGIQIRRHNRKIHKDKIYKGGVLKKNQAEHFVFGFGLMDRVVYKGIECFIHARRTTGYFELRNIDMSRVHDSAPVRDIRLIRHERNIIYKKTFKRIDADSSDEAKNLAVSSACLL